MITETVRRITELEKETERLRVIETPLTSLCAPFLSLPGLRGFWPMSAFESGGDTYDQSGNGRTLTYNGNPTYGYTTLGAPYLAFDGNDYVRRGDEAGLDILGTETYVAAAVRGFTCGGWFYFGNTAAAQELVFSKGRGGVANTSYWLNRQAAGQGRFIIGDGAAFQGPTSTVTIPKDTWTFMVGRFVPSTTVDLWVNIYKSTDAAGIPAALLNTAAPLNIASYNDGTAAFLTGRASLVFLCATALSDALITSLWYKTRGAFGST